MVKEEARERWEMIRVLLVVGNRKVVARSSQERWEVGLYQQRRELTSSGRNINK